MYFRSWPAVSPGIKSLLRQEPSGRVWWRDNYHSSQEKQGEQKRAGPSQGVSFEDSVLSNLVPLPPNDTLISLELL